MLNRVRDWFRGSRRRQIGAISAGLGVIAVGVALPLYFTVFAGGDGSAERAQSIPTPSPVVSRPTPTPEPTPEPTPTELAKGSGLPAIVDPQELFIADADGGEPMLIHSSAGGVGSAAWSPEGDLLAYVVQRGAAAGELHIVTPGDESGVVVEVAGFVRSPVWSADGERLAFIRQMDADEALMVVRTDGSGLRELAQVQEYELSLGIVGWLPDGRLLAVQGREPSQGVLLEFDVASGQSRQVSDLHVRSDFFGVAQVSPDGARVAVSSGTAEGGCSYPGPLGSLWVIELTSGQAQQVTEEICGMSGASWSPDGAEIAYTVVELQSEASGVYVVALASGAVRRLTAPSQGVDVRVDWLPDGRSVLARRFSCVGCEAGPPSLVLVPAAGGEERVLVDHRLSDISPDGGVVVFAHDGLQLTSVDGSERRTLIPADLDWDYVSLQWSPDNRRLAFVRRHSRLTRQFEVNIDGSDLKRLADLGPDFHPSPDGTRLAFRKPSEVKPGEDQVTLWLSDADGSNQVQIDVVAPGIPQWSPDGSRLIVNGSPDSALFVVNADGSGLRRLAQAANISSEAVWSPDGTKIATGEGLQIINVDSGDVETIALEAQQPFEQPSWSGDGRRLAFTARGAGESDVFVVNVDGTGLKQLTDDPAPDFGPAVSPDGRFVAFRRSSGQHRIDLVVVNVETLEERVLFDREVSGGSVEDRPVWSPDGSRLALFALARDGHGIYILNSDGSGLYQLVATTTNILELRWRSDQRLYFVSAIQGLG